MLPNFKFAGVGPLLQVYCEALLERLYSAIQ
jgi:hypothetical protein